MKKDKVYIFSLAFGFAGSIFALFQSIYCLPLFIIAFLLRPLLSYFPALKVQTDERELGIQSTSGDFAFLAIILALTGGLVIRALKGHYSDDYFFLIALGLILRYLIKLLLHGDFARTATIVFWALGTISSLFIVLEAGFSSPALIGVLLFILFYFLGKSVRKFPIYTIVVTSLIITGLFFAFHSSFQYNLLLFVLFPLAVAFSSLLLYIIEQRYDYSPPKSLILIGIILFISSEVIGFMLQTDVKRPDKTMFSQIEDSTASKLYGIPVSGTAFFYEDDTTRLKAGILSRPHKFGNIVLPGGSKVYLSKNGCLDFAFLPFNYRIGEYDVKGEGPESWQTVFYPDGTVKVIWLAHDHIIQGVPCREANFWSELFSGESSVRFYSNGKIQHCKLAHDAYFQGQYIKKNRHLEFDSTGTIVKTY
ncbi:MAG: hypothetical protein LWX56_11905 [Ignavibacteria bacterium]|nr:hypothetical protein [Ignavibacteria bacterium]